MKNNKINNHLEYLSLTLIISYFFVDNIVFVLIGIILSIYLININFINIFIKSIYKRFTINQISIDLNKNANKQTSDPIEKKIKKDYSKLTLVETIEELGFIPSISESNDDEAA